MQYSQGFWADIQETINWYDEISRDVCERFLDEFWMAENKISKNPFAFSLVSKKNYRRYTFKNFPFKLFFKIEEQQVFIIALIHMSRSNKFIQSRLKKL